MGDPAGDAIDALMAEAESKFISASAGAVPPHLDDGGHLPFGGTVNGTSGPSAFGKRKIVTAGAANSPNPQQLLLNYPPEPTVENINCWERNYKSSLYLDPDPDMEAARLKTVNQLFYGAGSEPSYLAEDNRNGYGDVRRTDCTRPSPAPKFYPPEREDLGLPPESAIYDWQWPERSARAPMPQLERPAKVELNFMDSYSLRPPWLKY